MDISYSYNYAYLIRIFYIRAFIIIIIQQYFYSRFPEYNITEKDDLRKFITALANATYGTFKDVPMDNRIQPKDYLDYVMLLNCSISYIISTSHVEIFSSSDLLPTITELGLCYTYNGEIAPYNQYQLVVNNKKAYT